MAAHILGEKPKLHRRVINGASLYIVYTDWKQVAKQRYITPIVGALYWFEGDERYEPQWAIRAWDHDENRVLTFMLTGIKFEGRGAL